MPGTKSSHTATVKSRAASATILPSYPRLKGTTVRYQRVAPRVLSMALYSAFAGGVASFVLPATPGWANPQGQQVVRGQATFQSSGNTLTVTNTPGAAVNWQSFSIKANETTHFQQANSSSTVLNRVVNNNPSELLGNLTSNGKVVLINPFGITVGRGAAVDTAGFTASTLNITDADWANGKLRFQGNSLSGDVKVDGVIRSANGDVMLFAPNVTVGSNALVKADNGNVIIGAGQKVEVTGRGLEGIRFEIQSADNKAINLGTIEGNAVGVFAGTLRHSGVIKAQLASMEGGKVVLRAIKDVEVSGPNMVITADGAAGKAGGQVSISSATGDVLIGTGARITANGGAGVNLASVGAGGTIAMTAEQGKLVVEQGAALSANGSPAGSIRLLAATDTRVAGVLNAASPVRADSSTDIQPISLATGGKVEVLGKTVSLETGAQVDVSGDGGGGVILVGGDFQGSNPDVPNAQSTNVAPGVTLNADGRAQGNGGKVIVWADNDTNFSGTISAKGGLLGGNGGTAETSGKHVLFYRGRTNLSAARGSAGTLLLDPDSITIQSGSQDGTDLDTFANTLNNGTGAGTVNTGPGAFTIYESEIENTAANILLVANNKISTSGSFITAGGAITLLSNFNLTMQVTNATNTGDGIDLTGSFNGSSLRFVTQGTGSINLSTTGSSANGGITLSSLVTSGGTVTVSSAGTLTNVGGITVGGIGAVSLTSGFASSTALTAGSITTLGGNLFMTANNGGTVLIRPSISTSGGGVTAIGAEVLVLSGASSGNVNTGVGNISLTATGTTGRVQVDYGMGLTGSAVSIKANRVWIDTSAASVTGTSQVILAPYDAPRSIEIGGDDTSATGIFGITAGEIARITTPILQVGNAAFDTGNITISQAVTLPGALVLATGGDISQGVLLPITASGLRLEGANVFLQSQNLVTTLAAKATGDLFYRSSGSFTVGTVAGLSGAAVTGGGVTLQTNVGGSTITLSSDVKSAGGDIGFYTDHLRIAGNVLVDSNTTTLGNAGAIYLGADLSADALGRKLTIDASAVQASMNGGNVDLPTVTNFGGAYLSLLDINAQSGTGGNKGTITIAGNVTLAASGTGSANQATLSIANALVNVNSNATINTNGSGATVASDGGLINLSTSTLGGGANRRSLTLLANAGTGASSAGSIKLGTADVVGAGTRLGSLTANALGTAGKIYLYGNLSTDALTTSGISGNIALDSTAGVVLQVSSIAMDTSLNNASPQAGGVIINSTTGAGISAAGQGYQLTINTMPANASGSAVAGNVSLPGFDNAAGAYINTLSVVATTTAGTNEGVVTLRGDVLLDRGAALDGAEASLVISAGYLELAKPNGTTTLIDTLVQTTGKGGAVNIDVARINTTSGTGFKIDTSSVDNIRKGGDIQLAGTISSAGASTGVAPGSVWLDTGTSVGQISGQIHLYDPMEVANNGAITVKGETLIHGNYRLGNTSGTINNSITIAGSMDSFSASNPLTLSAGPGGTVDTTGATIGRGYLGFPSAAIPSTVNITGAALNLGVIKGGSVTLTGGTLDLDEIEAYGGSIMATGSSALLRNTLQTSGGGISVTTTGSLTVQNGVLIRSNGASGSNSDGGAAGNITLKSSGGSITLGNNVSVLSTGGAGDGTLVSGDTAYAGGAGGDLKLDANGALNLGTGITFSSTGGYGGWGLSTTGTGARGGTGGVGGSVSISAGVGALSIDAASTIASFGGLGGNGATGGVGADGALPGQAGGGNGGDGGKGGMAGDVTLSARTLTVSGALLSQGGQGGDGALGGNGGSGAAGTASLPGGKGGSAGIGGRGGNGGDAGTVSISNTVASTLTLSGGTIASFAGTGGAGNDPGLPGNGGASGGAGAGADGDAGYQNSQGYSGSSSLVSILSLDSLSLAGGALVQGGSADIRSVYTLSIADSQITVEAGALIKSNNAGITMSGMSTITSSSGTPSDSVDLQAPNGAIEITNISAPRIKVEGVSVTLLANGGLSSAYGGSISVESTGGSLTVQNNVTVSSVADADGRGGDITLDSSNGQLTIGQGVNIYSVGGDGFGADFSHDSNGQAGDGGDIVLAGRSGVTLAGGANTNIYSRGGMGGDGLYSAPHDGPDGGDGGAGGSISISSSNGSMLFIGNNVTLSSLGGNGGVGSAGGPGAAGLVGGGAGGKGLNGGNGGLGGDGGTISLSAQALSYKGVIITQGGSGGDAGAGGQGGAGGASAGTGGAGGNGGDAGQPGQGGNGGSIEMNASIGSITLTNGQVNSLGGDGGVGAVGGVAGLGGTGGVTNGVNGSPGAASYLLNGPDGSGRSVSMTSAGGTGLSTLSMRGGSVSILALSSDVNLGDGTSIQADDSVDVTSATGSIYMTGSAAIELLTYNPGDLIDLHAANDVQLTYLNGHTMNVVGGSIYSDTLYSGKNLKGAFAYLGASTLYADVGSMTKPVVVDLGYHQGLWVEGNRNIWVSSPSNFYLGSVQVHASTGSGTISAGTSQYLSVYTGTTGGVGGANVGVHLSGGNGLEVLTGATVTASGTGNLDLDAYNTVHVEGGAMSASGDINISSTVGLAYVYSPGSVTSSSGNINITGSKVEIEGSVSTATGAVNVTSTGAGGIDISGLVHSGRASAGPAVVLVTDTLDLSGSVTTGGGSASVAILPFGLARDIDIIRATTAPDSEHLSLVVEDLANISAAFIQIGDISQTSGNITFLDPTSGIGPALALYAGGSISQLGTVNLNGLMAKAAGNVTLADPANTFGTIAGYGGVGFTLASAGSLTVASVAGVSGIGSGSGNGISLTSAGGMSISGDVIAGGGSDNSAVALNAAGTIDVTNALVQGKVTGGLGVSLVADDLNLNGTATVSADGSGVAINPFTAGRAFVAGTGAGFSLTSTELGKIQNLDTLSVGSGDFGYAFGSITVGTAWNAGGALVLNGAGQVSGTGAIGATSLDVRGSSVDLSGNNSLSSGLVQGNASGGIFNLKVVTANGIVVNDDGIYGSGGVTLTATTGAITNAATSTTQSIASGNIVLNAATGVGTSAANGRMRLDSNGQVSVNAGTGAVWLQFANDQYLGTIASAAGQNTIDILSTAGNFYVQGTNTGDDAWNIQTVGQITLDPGSISGATATLASSSGAVVGPTLATAAALSVTGHLELSGRDIGAGSAPLWFAADNVTATQTSTVGNIQMHSVNAISTSKVQYVTATYSTNTTLESAGIISVDTDLTNLVGAEGLANLTSSAGIRFNKAGGNTVLRAVNLTGPVQSSTSVTFHESVYSGDWTVSGGTTSFGGFTTALSGVVNITGGTLEAAADVQVDTLSNQSGGTLRLSGGNLSVNTSVSSQAGLLDLGTSGTLSVIQGNLTNTGTITGSGGITLMGGGSGGTLVNDGTIAPGGDGAIGTISIGFGNLTQDPAGRILMDFQGMTSGSYDHIDVQGLYTSGGTVSISEGAMPVLMPGDQASAISYGSVNAASQDAIESLASGIIFQGGYTAGPGGNLMIKVQSITNSWTKDSNATEQWEAAANWSRGHAPLAGEDAYLSVANNPTITVSLNNNYVRSVDLHEHLVIGPGGYIDVSGGSLAAASGTVVDITSGALGGSGDFQFYSGSTLNWSGGLMSGSGTAYVNAGAKLNLLTGSGPLLQRAMANTGSIDVNASLDLTGGSLTNQNTGSLVVHGNGQMFYGSGTLYNAAGGTIGIAAGLSTYAQITAPLDNAGEINVTGADLVLPAGMSSGQINIDPSRTLKLAGSFASPGFIANYGGTLRLEPSISTLSVGGTYFEVVPSSLSIGGNGSVVINTNVSTAQLLQDGADVFGTGNINAVLLNASNVGSMGGTGTLTTSGLASSSAAFFMNRKWNIQGGLNLTAGYLNVGTGATVTNQVGSLLDVSTSYLGVSSTIYGAGTLNNAGQLRNSFKSAMATELLYIDVANLNNSGSITFGADGANPVRNLGIGSTFNSYSASVAIPAGKKVSFGGAAAFDSGSVVNGAGTLAISGGTTSFTGSYNNTGVLEVGGTMNFNTGSGVTIPTLVLTGILGGNDAVTVTTAATLGGNITTGAGVFKIAGGATATMASGLAVDTRTLRNDGTLTLTGGTLMLVGQATLSNAGVLNHGGNSDVQDFSDTFAGTVSNEPGSVYNFSSTTGIGIEPQFVNKVGAQVNVLSGQMVFEAGITQSGTVNVAGGATLATGPGVTLNNLAGGLITGSGTIDVSGGGLYNYGTVAPGTAGALGTLNLKGGYFQQSGGTLLIRAGSATTSDKLNITGGATLDGTLTVGTFGGYTVGVGASYTALSSSIGYSGTFTVINSPAGVTLQPGYNGFNVMLSNSGAINNWTGSDGDWSNSANWSLGHVPLTGEAVTINPAGIHTITLTTAAASSLYSLDFSSAGNDDIFLFSTGGTLALPTLATLGGTVSIAGGLLSNANVGQSINKLLLSSGTLSNSGAIYVPAMSLSGGVVSGAGTLYSSGAFNWSNGLISGGGLQTSGATTLASGTHGLANVVWINTGTVTHSGGNFSLTSASIANQGVFTDTAAGGALFSVVSGTNIFHNNGGTFNFSETGSRDSGLLSAFNNDGTINVAGGATANIQAGGTDIGYWDVATGGTLQFASGSRSLAPGGETVKGAGKLNVSGGVVSLSSPLFNIASTGAVGMTGGTLDLASGGALSFANAVSLSGGSSLLANNGATFAALSLSAGATLGGGGNKLVTGTLAVDNSTLAGGTLTTQGNSTLSGTLDTLSSMSWLNQGSLAVSSAEVALAGSSLTNASGATLSVQGAAGTGFSSASSGSIVNNGTMQWTLASGSRSIASPVSFNNSATGTLNVLGGTMDVASGSFTQAGTLDIAGGATFKRTGGLSNSGRIQGTGTVLATGGNLGNSGLLLLSGTVDLGSGTLLNSGGSIRPADNAVGTLSVIGNVSYAGGTVNMDLASAASYDKVVASGNIITGGTINVAESTPFIAGGAVFNFFTYTGSSSGGAFTINQSIPDVTFGISGGSGFAGITATTVTNRWKDNISGDWATALNWSRGHAPNSVESVIINPLGTQVIALTTGAQAGQSLTVLGDDTLVMSGGSLVLQQASTIGSGAAFALSGGSVATAGAFGVASSFNWSGGTITGLGTLTTNGVVSLSGGSTKNLDGKVWNITAGTVNYTGGNLALVGAGAALNLGSGATFNVLTSDGVGSDIRGLGTFSAASGSTLNLNAPTASNSIYTQVVNLAGTTNLLNGEMDFDRDTGSTTINLSGVLNMANGTRIKGYSTLGGPVVTLNVNAGAAINVTAGTATLDVNNWDLFFNTPMTLPTALNISQSGNTVTAGSALAVGGAYTLSGGTLTGAGSVALNGPFNWGGGTVTGGGALSTGGTSTLGNTVSLDGKAWNNSGSISIGSGTTLLLKSGALLNNLAAGTLSVGNTGGQGIGNGAGGGAVSNAGLLALNSSTIATGGGSISNSGLLTGSGTLDLAGSGTFTNTGTVAPGGTGTIGLIAVTGHASLAAGVLQAELDSTSSYDQLTVSGNLVQGGTIAVSERATPFVGAGNIFNVVTYGGTLTGSASTLASSIGGVALSLNSGSGLLQLEAMTVTNSWKDNVSGDWSTGANWTRGHAPNSQEDAVIAPAGFQTITLSAGAQSPRSLQLTDNDVLTISGGTLSISNASTVVSAASLLMSGGMLAGTGNLDIAGTFVFSGGTLGGTGTMSTSGASKIAAGVNPRTIARDWSNFGTLTWDSGSVSLNSHLFNMAGATVNFNIYDGNDDLGGSGTLANASGATVRVSSSAFDTSLLATLVNDGDVFIDAGKLDLHKGATHVGTFTIASGAELRTRDNETHTFAPGSVISGAGTYRQTFDAPTVNVQGDFTPANVVLGAGTLAFSAGGTQSVSTLAVNGGTLSLGGTLSAGSASITTAGASLVTVNGSGLLDATQLRIDASGSSSGYLAVGSGAAISTVNGVVYGKVGRNSGSDIVLDGRLSEDNGTAFTDYLTLNDATIGGSGTLGVVAGSLNMWGTTKIGAVLEESSTGQIDFGLNGAFTVSGAGSRLNGNVRVLSGAVADFTGANLSQSSTGGLYSSGTVNISNGAAFNGIVSIDGGNFNVSGPAVTVSGASASVFIDETSTLNVNGGTLSFGGNDLWNSGLLHVAAGARAELSTTGYNTPNVTQAGTISIDAGGTFALLAGGNYSSVAGATPAVTGAGKLLVSGGTLTAGSAVDVGSLSITSGSVSVTGADLKAGGFNQTGGSVTGNGSFTVTSSFNQSAGTLGTGFNNISITQQTGNLAVGNLQAVNTVTLSAAAGSITDSNGAATNVTGSSVKLLALSGIDLDLNTPVVDATLTSAGSLDISNTGALQIAALSSQGSASITTAGTLTQAGAINVIGATTLSTGGAGVTLTHLANDFGGTVSLVGAGATSLKDSGTLAITGGASSLSLDGGAVQVGTLTVSGPLTIVATGQIGQSGGISVTGLTNLSAASIVLPTASTYGGGITFSSTGDVTLNSGGAMVLGGTSNTAGGNVSLTALGPVSQTAALTVNGAAVVSAAGQPVNFGTQLNDFASVSFTAASVQVRDINSLAIGGNVAGNVAVQAASGVSGSNFSFGSVDVTLSGLGAVLFSGVDVAGAANFATSGTLGSYSGISYSNNSSTGTLGSPIVATGLVDLAFTNAGIALPQIQAATLFASGGGAITQTGPINAGVTHISGQSALLNIPSNHLGALTLNTGNASIVDAGALNLSGLASGTLQVQAGAITQSAANALIAGSATISGAGGIALIGANELGTLSASSGGAITLNDVGATLALGNVTTAGSLVVQSGGAVVQMAGTTLSSASLDMIALSIGSVAQPLEFIAPSVQLASAVGDIRAHSAQSFNLVGLGAAGNASVVSDGALTVSAAAEALANLSLKGTNLVVHADVSGVGVTLDASSGTLAIGGGALAASVTGGHSVALIGHDITLLGGTGQGARAEVVSEGGVTVNAAGNFVIHGGSGNGALAQVSAFGPLSITVGGAVSVTGGAGSGAYAKLDPSVRSALTVNAQSVSLQGGSGAGAYAAIVSEGDVTVVAPGGISMAAGTGLDADAVVVSYFGRVTLPNCNGCVKLTTPPLGNGVSDVGVLGGDEYVSFLSSSVVGTNEILHFQEVFDVLVDKPVKKALKDDIVVETVCK
ncbi:hypothetical protein BH11PSE7_BH11PSE7_05310 [soil metagenome]